MNRLTLKELKELLAEQPAEWDDYPIFWVDFSHCRKQDVVVRVEKTDEDGKPLDSPYITITE